MHLLTDGTPIQIRAIRADDGERLRALHARLSPESRYRRFLGAKPTLSAADTRYLVDVDGCAHFALVATAPVHGRAGEIIAVARYIAAADAPGTAEFAIVVGDAYQRQGLAGELLGRLAEAAVQRGIRRFRAVTLADNVAIQRLLTHLADGEVERHTRGSIAELEIELRSDPARRDERALPTAA